MRVAGRIQCVGPAFAEVVAGPKMSRAGDLLPKTDHGLYDGASIPIVSIVVPPI